MSASSPPTHVALRLDDAEVAAFLEHLDAEQRRFLVTLHQAQRLLGERGSLTAVAAEQWRMVRRVLDAQRAIIRRCAEAHAAVDELEATAELNVNQVRAHRDATRTALLTGADAEVSGPLYRKAAGADALLERIEDQLARMPYSDEGEDQTLAECWRQLLDRAWREENERCVTTLVAAQVDAEIRVHEERVAARAALAEARRASTGPAPERVAQTTVLASPLFAALDHVEDEALEGCIDRLLDELQDDESGPITLAPSDEQLARELDASRGRLDAENRRNEDEAFVRFWTVVGVRRPPRPRRRAWSVRSALPSIGLIVGAASWLTR